MDNWFTNAFVVIKEANQKNKPKHAIQEFSL